MHVWNVAHAARWKYRTQKNRHLRTIAQLCQAISSPLRHVSTVGKKVVKQQYLPHMSLQYSELQPTNGLDPFWSLGYRSKFQWVLCLGSVTAQHCSSASAKLCGVEHRVPTIFGREASHWALAHILVIIFLPCDFYLSSFCLSFFLFFSHLISVAVDWMSTILPHMVWP